MGGFWACQLMSEFGVDEGALDTSSSGGGWDWLFRMLIMPTFRD